jgi:hypothetical protein
MHLPLGSQPSWESRVQYSTPHLSRHHCLPENIESSLAHRRLGVRAQATKLLFARSGPARAELALGILSALNDCER